MKKPDNWRSKMMEPPAVDVVAENEKDEGIVEEGDGEEEYDDSDEWEDTVPIKKQKLCS